MKLINETHNGKTIFGVNEISDPEDLTVWRNIHYILPRTKYHKIHILPQFFKTHKTIRMLNGQEGESKHAAIDIELRSFARVHNRVE